ncbi:hypothetical protein [Leptolyngbya sp. ST-U4]|uniref:hypothetical protein n=1 Tax=Leptolyngbya sp. ST-U4 TaxID=2933912 RepID=UPI0032980DD3
MNPSEISSLLQQAKASSEVFPAGIHTFALYWITWEAYRTRMLAVATRLRGWRIADAYLAIGTRKISTQKIYKRCFKGVTGVELSEQPGIVARVLPNLDLIESLRHRLVHGYRSANPELIQASNEFLDAILTHHEKVFGKIVIPLQDGTQIQLGNVLAKRPCDGRGIPIQNNYELLKPCFELKDTAKRDGLPDRSIVHTLEKIVVHLRSG